MGAKNIFSFSISQHEITRFLAWGLRKKVCCVLLWHYNFFFVVGMNLSWNKHSTKSHRGPAGTSSPKLPASDPEANQKIPLRSIYQVPDQDWHLQIKYSYIPRTIIDWNNLPPPPIFQISVTQISLNQQLSSTSVTKIKQETSRTK